MCLFGGNSTEFHGVFQDRVFAPLKCLRPTRMAATYQAWHPRLCLQHLATALALRKGTAKKKKKNFQHFNTMYCFFSLKCMYIYIYDYICISLLWHINIVMQNTTVCELIACTKYIKHCCSCHILPLPFYPCWILFSPTFVLAEAGIAR